MRITILENGSAGVTTAVLAVLAALPLLVVPGLVDPFESPRAMAAALALALVFAVGRRERGWRLSRPAALCIGALFVLYVAAALASHPASSVWGVMGRFQGLLSFVVLVLALLLGSQLSGARVLVAAKWLAGVTALLSAIVIAQALSGGLPQAFFGNTAVAGAWLAVGTGTTLATIVASPAATRARRLLAATAVAGMLAIGLTGARAAVLAVIVAGVAVVSVADRATRRRAVLAAAVGLAVLATGVLVRGGEAADKFTPAALASGSAQSRLEIWRGTAEMIAARPVLGVGPGRFVYEFPAHQSVAHALSEGPDVRPDQAHNLVLQYAAEAGVPAAVLWGALCVVALLAAWRAARRGNGSGVIALGSLAAYVTQALFGVAAVETDVVGWLFLGVALASGRDLRPAGRVANVVFVVAAVAVGLACAWYVGANARFARGTALFTQGDMVLSEAVLDSAVDADPLTDIYRVALADTASYLEAPSQEAALQALERGLVLEPRSYDLALARARMLKTLGRPAPVVAQAYSEALDLYPLGVTVRTETIAALRSAGNTARADQEQAVLDRLAAPAQGAAP